MKMRNLKLGILFIGIGLALNSHAQITWPPVLTGSDKNGVAVLKNPDLLKIPASIQQVLDANPEIKLEIAKHVPKVELVYHNELNNAAINGTGWSSWGDICLASDGRVYSGIGNHWKTDKGESYIYSWDPAKSVLKKISDINQSNGAKANDVRFSKVHAHIIEGSDKKIYFTGTLDDGSKAGHDEMLSKWTTNIAGGKLLQFDPKTAKTIVYADFPAARVTATTKYDSSRNILYAEIEGDPKGISLGAFDMATKKWIFQSESGSVSHHRDMMMDKQGNIYFNGKQNKISDQMVLRGGVYYPAIKKADSTSTSMLPPDQSDRLKNIPLTELWKYSPETRTIQATKSTSIGGIRSSTRESKAGYIYGTTMGNQLFRYSPARDELTIIGSNFLKNGEYITVCDLSADEKYLYYLPGAHGSAGFSGTPVIQYNIASGKQKAIAFLSESMLNAYNYAPGGTYGLKISADGSKLYIGLNGSPTDALRPKGLGRGFGLTSFAVIHIPAEER